MLTDDADSVSKALDLFTYSISRFSTHIKSHTKITIRHIRGDSDSAFKAAELKEWALKRKTTITLAAPHHQEMNTQAESRWNQIMITARKMLVHARLGIPFNLLCIQTCKCNTQHLAIQWPEDKRMKIMHTIRKSIRYKTTPTALQGFRLPNRFQTPLTSFEIKQEQMGTSSKEEPNPKSITRHSHWTFTWSSRIPHMDRKPNRKQTCTHLTRRHLWWTIWIINTNSDHSFPRSTPNQKCRTTKWWIWQWWWRHRNRTHR